MNNFTALFFSVLVLTSVPGTSIAQTSFNVSLFGTLNPVPIRYSGSWGYTAPGGAEYALLGGFQGTHIIAIDDSTDIHQIDFVDGQDSNWREITVIGDHAYVVTEGGGDLQGMQVIALSFLPDSVHLVTTYTGTFLRSHIIMRDITTEDPVVYVSGTSSTGGVHMIDVSDPANPIQVGLYNPPYYIHDAHVRGTLLFASALSTGLDIVDIADKANPMLLSRIEHQAQFTHSTWTTSDLSHVVVTDEVDGLPARIWDIRDLDNPVEVSQYSANLQSLVHNPYVLGGLVFLSHNTEGMRVLDIRDPALPVEVGYYDTYAGPSGGFNGLWSAYPYFPSGKIIGGNREDGLYVWRFNGTRAVRVYGVVLDSSSGEPIADAEITLVETGNSGNSASDGSFRIGDLPPDSTGYSLLVTAAGFAPGAIDSLFMPGSDDSLWVEFRLASVVSSVDDPQIAGRRLPLPEFPQPVQWFLHLHLSNPRCSQQHLLNLFCIADRLRSPGTEGRTARQRRIASRHPLQYLDRIG
jgi:choice-of-anchor B domain-containing protein